MGANITLLEIGDEKISLQVSLLVDRLQSIDELYKRALSTGSLTKLADNTTYLLGNVLPQGIPPVGDAPKVDLTPVKKALQIDANSLSKVLFHRLSSQHKAYLKEIERTSKEVGLFPDRTDGVDFEQEMAASLLALNASIDAWPTDEIPQIKIIDDTLLKANTVFSLYNEKMSKLWMEIERLAKFRNDHSRLRIAQLALWLSIFLLIFGQSKNIYENAKWMLSFF